MVTTLKPGTRVTSPLLVGEWYVTRTCGEFTADVVRGPASAQLPTRDLTPVAPPLPPEPAVGSVVRAHGRPWLRLQSDGLWWADDGSCETWGFLACADDLSPVVPVDDVADWLQRVDYYGAGNAVRAEFGWDK